MLAKFRMVITRLTHGASGTEVRGVQSGGDVVVESGLTSGTIVIVEGIQKVRPGMKVEPEPLQAPAAAPLETT